MRGLRAATAAMAGASVVLIAALPDRASLSSNDWPQYRHDAQSTWSNAGSFAPDQAALLQQLWAVDLGAPVYAEPIVANGTVYVTTAYHSGMVIALDAATGAKKWSRQFLFTLSTNCGTFNPGIWDAPAVINGVLYVGAPDGKVYALDANTGATIWAAQVAQPTPHGEFLASSPSVSTALGKLYIGTSAITDCDLPPGKIASVDLATGTPLVRDVLAPGRQGGSIWSTISIDEAAGRVYATTGNPLHAPSNDPYSQSIVAYDAHTLQPLDHWQDPTYTSFEDSDFGASPTLFNATDGTPLVAAPNKDGWLYTWRRANLSAGPLWKYSLAVNGGPDNGRGSIVAPTFANGLLYAAGGATPAGSHPGSVVAFDPGTGAVQWVHYPAGYVIAGMPAVGGVLVAGVTAAGNGSGSLEILDAHTGALLRSFPSAKPLWAAPVAAEGMIFFVNTAGHLVALGVPGGATDGGGVPDAGNTNDGGTTDGGAADGGSNDGGTTDGGTNAGPQVLFQDSFSYRGPLGAGWQVVSGAFTADGAHAQPGAARAYAVVTVNAPDASTVAATVGVLSGTAYNGVIARAQLASPVANHYAAYMNADGSLWIARRNGYTYTYLGHSATKVNGTVPHRLALSTRTVAQGVELDLVVDGVPSFSVIDSSAQKLGAGRAGMFSYQGTGAAFDDFELSTP